MDARISEEFNASVFEAVAKIWSETCVGNPARGDTFASVAATLAHGGKLFTVHSTDGLVGVCWITDDGRRLYLHHMAIAPMHQGRGHAKVLMDRAIEYAQERGLQMKLEVHRDNARARKLYQAYGFASLGDYEVFIRRDLGR
jgi:ribosomal protein S18 acetylase RimI-like enzyme